MAPTTDEVPIRMRIMTGQIIGSHGVPYGPIYTVLDGKVYCHAAASQPQDLGDYFEFMADVRAGHKYPHFVKATGLEARMFRCRQSYQRLAERLADDGQMAQAIQAGKVAEVLTALLAGEEPAAD